MLRLASDLNQRKVRQAIEAAADGERYEVRLGLFASGEDYSERFEKGEWGQHEQAITLDASITGYVPRTFVDKKVNLYVEVDGVLIPQVPAQKSAILPSDDAYSTDILASSAASLATGEDAIKLGSFTEYRGLRPEKVAFDALRRLPYRKNLIDVSGVKGMVLNWYGSGVTSQGGFEAQEPVGAVLSRLKDPEGVAYDFQDTAFGGVKARRLDPLRFPNGDAPDYHYRQYTSDQFADWDLGRPTPPSERFSHIRVYKTDPITGRLAWEHVEEVQYPPFVTPPQKHRTKEIRWPDTQDDEDAQRWTARERCVKEAMFQARLICEGDELTLPAFDPLLERRDPIWVVEQFADGEDAFYETSWRLRVSDYRHTFGQGTTRNSHVGSLDTTVGYQAAILSEEKIKRGFTFLSPLTRTNGSVALTTPLYGVLPADELYFNTPTAFASVTGDDVIFDSASGGSSAIASASDDIVVSQ